MDWIDDDVGDWRSITANPYNDVMEPLFWLGLPEIIAPRAGMR